MISLLDFVISRTCEAKAFYHKISKYIHKMLLIELDPTSGFTQQTANHSDSDITHPSKAKVLHEFLAL